MSWTATPVRVTGRLPEADGGLIIAVGPDRSTVAGGAGGAQFVTETGWVYDASSGRYRDLKTGAFVSPDVIRQLRNDFVDTRRAAMVDLSRQLGAGTLSLDDWQAAMRAEIKMSVGIEYAFGRGGLLAMTPDDWNTVGTLVSDQWDYLDGFAGDLQDGKLSGAQLLNRAGRYADAGVQGFERGQASAFDVELPEYPGENCDGGSNCRCYWELEEQDDGTVDAYWNAVDDANTCDPCSQNADQYNPYTIDTGEFSAPPGGPVLDPANLSAYILARLDHADDYRRAQSMGRLLQDQFGGAPTYPQGEPTKPTAGFADEGGGHWITLDDGRHIFIEDKGAKESAGGARSLWNRLTGRQSEAGAQNKTLSSIGVHPSAAYAAKAQANLDAVRANVANAVHTTPEHLSAVVDDKLQRFMDNADLRIRVPEDVWSQIAADGVRNQLETGHSSALVDPRGRLQSEQAAFADFAALLAAVPAMVAFNAPGKDDPESLAQHPKYAYFENPSVGTNRMAEMYGGIELTLKPDVKERTTMTLGDSLGPLSQSQVLPQPATHPDWRAVVDGPALIDTYLAPDLKGVQRAGGYFEGQIHGQLKPSDIAYIRLQHVYNPAGIRETARKAGIEVRE